MSTSAPTEKTAAEKPTTTTTTTTEDDPSLTRIYVTNLNFNTVDKELEDWFRQQLKDEKMKVTSNIVTFRRGTTIRSRGYAFILIDNHHVEKAIALDGQVLMDRPLTIKLANTRRTDEEKSVAREEREKKREETKAKRTSTSTSTSTPSESKKAPRAAKTKATKTSSTDATTQQPTTTDVRIRINNVNYNATPEELQEFVEKALGGKPVECSIVAYTRAGASRSRGYAHLTVTASQVDAALAMDGQTFAEREIRVRRSAIRNGTQGEEQTQTQTQTPAKPAATTTTAKPTKGKKRQESETKQSTPAPATTTPAATKPKRAPREAKEEKTPAPERKRRERPEVTDFKAENTEIGIHSDFPLIDIGANLIDRRYRDFDTVVKRAHAAGVTRIILTGTNLETTKAAIELVKKYPGQIYTTVGIHPHNAKKCTDEMLTELETLAKSGHIVAIGECGLDFNRDYSPRDVQIKVFEQQVAIACKLKLPLFLHEREAHTELLSVLSKHKDLPPVVIHCFTGTQTELQAYVKAGYSIGLTGFIAMKGRGEEIRKILSEIPLKQLMVETDAPYMSPNGDIRVKRFRNRNEPVTLPIVVETIQQNTKHTLKEVAEATTANAVKFFQLK